MLWVCCAFRQVVQHCKASKAQAFLETMGLLCFEAGGAKLPCMRRCGRLFNTAKPTQAAIPVPCTLKIRLSSTDRVVTVHSQGDSKYSGRPGPVGLRPKTRHVFVWDGFSSGLQGSCSLFLETCPASAAKYSMLMRRGLSVSAS